MNPELLSACSIKCMLLPNPWRIGLFVFSSPKNWVPFKTQNSLKKQNGTYVGTNKSPTVIGSAGVHTSYQVPGICQIWGSISQNGVDIWLLRVFGRYAWTSLYTIVIYHPTWSTLTFPWWCIWCPACFFIPVVCRFIVFRQVGKYDINSLTLPKFQIENRVVCRFNDLTRLSSCKMLCSIPLVQNWL